MTTDDLVRLGQYVMSRRAALGYKHRVDLANDLPFTDRTLADIENGARRSGPGTYAILENALQWRPGSVAAILDGHEPTAAAEPAEPADGQLDEVSVDELFAGLDEIVEALHEIVEALRRMVPSDGSGVAHKPKQPPVTFGWLGRSGKKPRMRRNQ